MAPAVIIMDEVDSIAGSRNSEGFRHLRDIVSQLLALMDGLVDRGRVLVIATTNRPESIDPAILRPGRIDRRIFMGPPDKLGRSTLFDKLLSRMPTAEDVQILKLVKVTSDFSGAEIEHVVNEAGLLAIKDAITKQIPTHSLHVSISHLLRAVINHRKHVAPLPPLSSRIS